MEEQIVGSGSSDIILNESANKIRRVDSLNSQEYINDFQNLENLQKEQLRYVQQLEKDINKTEFSKEQKDNEKNIQMYEEMFE